MVPTEVHSPSSRVPFGRSGPSLIGDRPLGGLLDPGVDEYPVLKLPTKPPLKLLQLR